MKILRSIHSLNPEIGGPIESVRQSSLAMTQRGHEVEIATLDAPDADWLGSVAVKVHAFGPARGSYGYTPRFVPWLRKRRAAYDAVIVHGIWQYSSFAVWRALRATTTPYFVFPHGMLDPWFNRTYPLKHLKKLLYWRWGEYRVLRDAAAVFFTSEEERRLAATSFSPYRCNGVVVDYGTAAPAVDLDLAREKFLDRVPQVRGKRLMLFLGRLHEKKGCDLLIHAFRDVWQARRDSDLHLVIAGPAATDEYLRELKASASDPPELPITFAGMLSGDLKWGALACAEAFVLPSHQENFGIAVAEALACGTPVLISNQVNIWREIVASEAGFADEDTREGTARLLNRWLALDADAQQRMRGAARGCFAAHFELGRATENLLDVIASFAARETRPATTLTLSRTR